MVKDIKCEFLFQRNEIFIFVKITFKAIEAYLKDSEADLQNIEVNPESFFLSFSAIVYFILATIKVFLTSVNFGMWKDVVVKNLYF